MRTLKDWQKLIPYNLLADLPIKNGVNVMPIIDKSGYCSVHEEYHCECYRPTDVGKSASSGVLTCEEAFEKEYPG